MEHILLSSLFSIVCDSRDNSPVVGGHIDNNKGIVGAQRHGDIGDLPVKKVPHVQLDLLSLLMEMFEQFGVVENESLPEKIGTGRQQLDGLYKVVRKITVELSCYDSPLFVGFFRKGNLKIGHYYPTAVADEGIQQQRQTVR